MSPTQTEPTQPTYQQPDLRDPASPVEGRVLSNRSNNEIQGADPLTIEGDGTPPDASQVTGTVISGVIVIAIGVYLAVALLSASDTRMALRGPALVAALLLVSHGVLMLITAKEPKRQDPAAREATAWLLLFLGLWLAVATLRIPSTDQLTTISYIASFVLFGLGWILLVRRPIAR